MPGSFPTITETQERMWNVVVHNMWLGVLGGGKRSWKSNTKAPEFPPSPFWRENGESIYSFTLPLSCNVFLIILLTLCLAWTRAEINVSTSAAPAGLRGGQSGTVTPVLSVCHSMEIDQTTATPLYMALQNGSLVSELCTKSHPHMNDMVETIFSLQISSVFSSECKWWSLVLQLSSCLMIFVMPLFQSKQ